jgi:hypothetical protein
MEAQRFPNKKGGRSRPLDGLVDGPTPVSAASRLGAWARASQANFGKPQCPRLFPGGAKAAVSSSRPDRLEDDEMSDTMRGRGKRVVESDRAAEKARREARREGIHAYHKAWREAHPEKWHAWNKAWREANPDKARARVMAWREANSEKWRAQQQAYREKNRERKRGYDKALRAANREKVRVAALEP